MNYEVIRDVKYLISTFREKLCENDVFLYKCCWIHSSKIRFTFMIKYY